MSELFCLACLGEKVRPFGSEEGEVRHCLVLIAVGILSGTIVQRPQVPMIVMSTSPERTV